MARQVCSSDFILRIVQDETQERKLDERAPDSKEKESTTTVSRHVTGPAETLLYKNIKHVTMH